MADHGLAYFTIHSNTLRMMLGMPEDAVIRQIDAAPVDCPGFRFLIQHPSFPQAEEGAGVPKITPIIGGDIIPDRSWSFGLGEEEEAPDD